MEILVLANFGMGLYKFRKELLEELIKQNNKVFISLPNDDYVPKLEAIGCEYIQSDVDRRGTNPITDLKLIKAYIDIIKKIKPDVVLTYTIKPNVYGGIACRLTKTPHITNVTGLGTSIENKGFMQKITLGFYKIGLKKSKCIFFQNEPNKQYFMNRHIINGKARVIPGSGVNLDQHQFEPYPENDDIIKLLYIGRIMKAKGIDELLEAIKRLQEKYSNIQFDLIGFCEEGYSKKLEELSCDGTIHYHGLQDDVHAYIKKAHAIILPSHHEGTSNVLLESASSGRPVLASKVPGCIETFDHGISGISFTVKNVDSLVDAITQFIKLPLEAKKEMGHAGRRKMEKEYDRKIVINAYIEEINNIKEGENELI